MNFDDMIALIKIAIEEKDWEAFRNAEWRLSRFLISLPDIPGPWKRLFLEVCKDDYPRY